ncbi:MAG TPA: TIGR02281 family clan AA aspartic protease [Mariprofundaceae bacterium]|nr:TIGR02281 family clan AA aspartic protease [Mariprofundaceae bacterium]
MLRTGWLILLGSLLLTVELAEAGVYSWTDASGRVHYSDTPKTGAKIHASGSVSSIGNPAYNLSGLKMQVPFIQTNGSMLVQGTINGIEMPFVVDTGASLVVIPPDMARLAGISMVGSRNILIQTANGQVSSPLVSIGVVKVSQVQRQNIDAVIQKISDDGRTGLLGMSFLKAYKVTVDHDNNMLILEAR